MKSGRKKFFISIMILMLTLVGLTIGYALLSSVLSINGSSSIKNSSWNIYWDNVQVTEGSVAADTPVIDSAKTTVTYNVVLEKPGDFYEFTVDAKNDGTIDAMIESITSKMNGYDLNQLPNYLYYDITYKDGAAIDDFQYLKSGKKETIKVRVEYDKNVTASDLPTTDQNLSFEFGMNYSQATSSAVVVNHVPLIGPVYDGTFGSEISQFRAYAYNMKIINAYFDNSINIPADAVDSWDISDSSTGSVVAYLVTNANDSTKYDLHIQGNGRIIANSNSSYLLSGLMKVKNVYNLELLDTSNVTDMSYMFFTVGYNNSSTTATLEIPSNFDTSNVTNMSYMFAGIKAGVLDLSSFDFSKVTNYAAMFGYYRSSGGSSESIGLVPATTTIYVKDQADLDWIVTHVGNEATGDDFKNSNPNITRANVLIKP